MRWLWTLAFIGTIGVGCKKAGEEALPPSDDEPARLGLAEAAPPVETHTYVSGRDGDEASEEEADDDADAADEAPKKGAPAAGITAAITTIAEARALAEETAQAALGAAESLSSPALIRRWPAEDRALIFVVYPLAPSKSGVNTFTVGAPIEVTVSLADGKAAHAPLKKSGVVGEVQRTRDPASLRANLEAAEQALIDVILERRSVGASLVLLDGYREWFNAHLAMMTDLDKRMPEGIRWLKSPKDSSP